MSDVVTLNVGGRHFVTRRSTLCDGDTFFAGLISVSDDSEVFVDRDPTHFRYILNWMRGCRRLPDDASALDELHEEASYYSMVDMCAAIQSARRVRVGDFFDQLRYANRTLSAIAP